MRWPNYRRPCPAWGYRLWVKVEKDFAAHGDECTYGGGKTLQDGIGDATSRLDDECLDLVITNALIIDWSGIVQS